MKYKKNINIFAKKIYGNVFIEASAGTGKTFTIIMLYLRFLLGINLKKKYNKPFSIKQILIVTFTKTACLELKKRIRENISELKKTIINKKKTKFTFFLKHITNIKQSIYLLQKAEEKIDNIEIYTIHGFCKKILENYSYKYPSKNNKLIIKDSKKIYLKATNQFWEKYYSTLPINLLTIILKYWKNPYELFKIIYPIIQIKKTIKKKTKKKRNIITQHLKIIEKIKNFKKKWIKIYSKIKKKKKKNIIIFKSIKKINNWAYCITKNYDIPKELSILKKKIKNNKKKIFKKFNKKIIIFINKVYIEKIKTEQYLIKHALNIIPKIVKKKKKKYIEYEDLINEIYKKVYKKQKFVQHIQKKYPIGFIDEFQDTDRKQYKIFNKIYKNQKTYLLLLIGDPKQAIYNFRGANIKTYFKARKKTQKIYTLHTNWRSSPNMNNAINTLFKRKKNPFCLKKINFTPTMSSNCHTNNKILIQSQEIKPLYIFTNTKKQKLHEYKKWSAEQCVNSISRWLYDNKNNLIIMKNILRPIKANDITILVNNKYEAEIIKKKLRKLNIQSIFYSKKKNIYKTEEAKEILYIFRAILNLENKKKFHAAIATNIITKNFEKLYNFNQTEKILKKFNKYKILWQKIGIFAVLWNIIKDFNTYNKKKYSSDINKINNLLYIGQLIEKKSKYIFDKYELIAWFKNKIFEKNNIKNKKKYIINDNYINISTIHMSKGSEYLITWIPFAMNYNKTWTKNNKLITNNKNIEKKTKKKQIAENLRLLYVALTRSILHCSISIAPIIQSKHKYKKNRILESHKSALGYLIQKKKDDTIAEFKKNIKKLSNDPYIHVHKNKIEPKKILQTYYKIKKYSYIKEKKKKNYINVLSYSKLCVKNKVIKKKYKNEIIIKKNNHTFPKGKNSGLMLHKILKKITFNKKIDTIIIKKEMKKYNIDKHWFKNLKKWIKYIVNYPLNEENFSLTQLKKNDYIKEMEFYIPIKNKLKCEIINKIIQKFDKFSKKSETMNFKKTKGLLIGYIDLIFKFKNKYYILDYKSNWLGSEDCHYKKKNIYKKIIQYRYDIQYQIYSIALHRYLKNKIQKYSFEKHFGGIYFLFIRAVNKKKKKNAIFYTLPKKKLIQKLNNLF